MLNAQYDIFLMHARQDAASATAVGRILTDAGFSVFSMMDKISGEPVWDVVRERLVECRFVVVIVSEVSSSSSNLAMEIGAAMSWRKPLYFVTEELSQRPSWLPLERSKIFPMSRMSALVEELQNKVRSISSEDREALQQAYQKLQIPIDLLLVRPDDLEMLAEEFARLRGTHIPGERLLQEMIRLQKQNKWPRLGKNPHAVSA